ncbi:hypothetical protein JTE90_029513 [Oedothorax gibbosus]|uniref:Uncharacterized protein n=1 Tax=Oedothorax gibbosus TaxID=931172 RepID=A0AAV6UHU8_9ARAC|nr:hypothetical protein JTE90_029513 [Oedothorax gibbosus]
MGADQYRVLMSPLLRQFAYSLLLGSQLYLKDLLMVVNLLHCSPDKRNTALGVIKSREEISQPFLWPSLPEENPMKLVARCLAFKYLAWSCTGDELIYDPIGSFFFFFLLSRNKKNIEDHSGHVRGVTVTEKKLRFCYFRTSYQSAEVLLQKEHP